MKVEVKSIVEGSGVRLSSIDGWSDGQLPKVLVVVSCDKVKMTPIRRPDGRQTKARDVEVRIGGYYLYYFEEASPDVFVAWPGSPTLREITSTRWEYQPEFLERIRSIAREANSLSSAPVRLQAEKNGGLCRLHYVCADHHRLPPCPTDLRALLEPTLDRIVGATLRLWKDHSAIGGPVGYVDEAMLHWEDHNRIKATGRLEVLLRSGDVLSFPEFKHGRQDYWGGFAIELVLESLAENLTRTAGGAAGVDLTLDDLLGPGPTPFATTVQLREVAHKEGKHALLRRIQALLDIDAAPTDISRGGTVTRSALREITRRIAEAQAIATIDVSTKASCIRTCLSALGAPYEQSDVSTGGTVTAYALLKVLLALEQTPPRPITPV